MLIAQNDKWQTWFAWRPVILDCCLKYPRGKVVWLRYVERVWVYRSPGMLRMGVGEWAYREIEEGKNV